MTKPIINSFSTLAPLITQAYERYLPTAFDESMSLLEKVNKVIQYCNDMGVISNDVITQWNTVMEWVMNEGLNESVLNKLNEMITDGTFDEIINQELLSNVKTRINDITINVQDFGAIGDGVADDTIAIQNAINSLFAVRNTVSHRNIHFPNIRYKITSTLQVNMDGVKFTGGGYFRPDVEGYGTRLELSTSSNTVDTPIALIQIGTNNGQPFDNGDYSGYEGFSIENMHLRFYSGNRTDLLNGLSTSWAYGINTYGIRDWKGGSISLRNVRIEGFEYGFWGIQSDINEWNNVYLWYNHIGAYLGPRSDQNTFTHVYTKYNDTAIKIDRASNSRFFGCHFVDDGSASTPALSIGSNYSSGSESIVFYGCWFEHYQGANEIECFVDLASGDGVTSNDITFRDCFVLHNAQNIDKHVKYFAKIGKVSRVIIENINGRLSNFIKLISFVGSGSPEVKLSIHATQKVSTPMYANYGTGTPKVSEYAWGNDKFQTNDTVFINKAGDGAILQTFNTDRAWDIMQRGADGSASLAFRDTGGDKSFKILSKDFVDCFEVIAKQVASGMPVAKVGGFDVLHKGNYATSGTTASRPTTDNFIGRYYYDTTLNKPIYRNNSNNGWVDSAGTTV